MPFAHVATEGQSWNIMATELSEGLRILVISRILRGLLLFNFSTGFFDVERL